MAYLFNKIKCNNEKINRDKLHIYLKKHGIGTSVHYRPLNLHSFWKNEIKNNQFKCEFKESEELYKNCLSLPIYPDLKNEEVGFIIKKLEISSLQYRIIKTIVDKFTSLILIVFLSPILVIISFLVFSLDGLPIFFLQERMSKNGKFKIFKFKTMRNKNFGYQVTQKNDTRITKLGTILRQFKLDELPQLFNILKGDMSFIGPRPESFYFLNIILKII